MSGVWVGVAFYLMPSHGDMYVFNHSALPSSTRCELSMNHWNDRVKHRITGARCQYSHHYDNKIQLCKVTPSLRSVFCPPAAWLTSPSLDSVLFTVSLSLSLSLSLSPADLF